MKAVVFTLGCKVNQCESASLISGLKEMGWDASTELSYADLYIINTCAVTAEAEKKSRQAVARVLKYNPDAEIIIAGCASEKSPLSFSGKQNVHLITGAKNKDKIFDIINKKGVFIEKDDVYYEKFIPDTSVKTRTFIKVQDGCDNFCSYCIVPYLRGRSRSRDPQNIKKEIERLAPTEAVITGINLSDYHYGEMGLADLLTELKDYDMRIRLGSLEVGAIDERFLDATSQLKDFAEHFHLSLQSGSAKTLSAMNRKYTPEEYASKVELIRKYYPNAGITTDIIVGFSTENSSDFEDSVSFVEKMRFSDIHCFAYSKREGTAAASLPELSPETKRVRLDRMMSVKLGLKDAFIEKNLGCEHEFVPEERVGEYTVGYTGNYIRSFVKGDVPYERCKIKLTAKYEDGALAEVLK